jgi:hypothetical protein
MSSQEWIHVINRAIDMNADYEVHDEESGVTFNFDVEALYDIQTALEAGATSEEIEHQFEEYVQGGFKRYVDVLQQALDGDDDDDDDSADAIDETNREPSKPDSNDADETLEAPVLEVEKRPSVSDASEDAENANGIVAPNKSSAGKKGVVIAAAIAGLLVVVGGGGFVGYQVLSSDSAPVAKTRTVETIARVSPKPMPQPTSELAATSSDAIPIMQTQPETYSVAQMGDPVSRGVPVTPPLTNPLPVQERAPVVAESRLLPMTQEPMRNGESLEQVKTEVSELFSSFEKSVKTEMGDRFQSMRESIGSLEERVAKIDDIERMVADQQSEQKKKNELMETRLSGLTRLGEFSILANAGVGGRVVALSPTNRVITLEEGEQNVFAAGNNLTVTEIVGDGDAVVFSGGWFIDAVRAPESLREQRSTTVSKDKQRTEDVTSQPAVPNTAKVAKSPSPAKVAANTSAERFPEIMRAPQGWAASALIPPRRAVLITPEGDSITVTSGYQIDGLGKVHSVKYDRVLAGQFYIPLSNM